MIILRQVVKSAVQISFHLLRVNHRIDFRQEHRMQEWQFKAKFELSDRNLNHSMVQVDLLSAQIDHLRLLVEFINHQMRALKEIRRC